MTCVSKNKYVSDNITPSSQNKRMNRNEQPTNKRVDVNFYKTSIDLIWYQKQFLLMYQYFLPLYINGSSWLYGIYNYLCHQCLSPLKLWVRTPFGWRVLDTTLCDSLSVTCERYWGRWFSLGIFVSSTNKTDCHDTTEILLKVALNIITLHKCLTSSTLAAVLAEVSINIKPCSLAKASPSSFFTSRLASKSLELKDNCFFHKNIFLTYF